MTLWYLIACAAVCLVNDNRLERRTAMTFTHMSVRILIIIALYSALALCQDGAPDGPSRAFQLKDCLPAKVGFLRELVKEAPSAARPRAVDPNNKWARRAKSASFDWIVKTVASDWLPKDPNVLHGQVAMMQNAFGPNDVTYSQWEANDHVVQVAQTATIVLIRVRPLSPDSTSTGTKEAHIALARNTVTHLLRSRVDVIETTSTERKKVKKTIMPDVLAASFDHADTQVCTDGVHGKCAPPELLEKRMHHYVWWWRCINWWTDGSEVDIYFLKTEGGPWVPSYTGELDATWFEGPPYRSKSRK
jgi:hypothetical protein